MEGELTFSKCTISILSFCGFGFLRMNSSLFTLFLGKDGGEDRILPHQLPHQSARIRKSFQGDALLRRKQRDGTDHSEERSGTDVCEWMGRCQNMQHFLITFCI